MCFVVVVKIDFLHFHTNRRYFLNIKLSFNSLTYFKSKTHQNPEIKLEYLSQINNYTHFFKFEFFE